MKPFPPVKVSEVLVPKQFFPLVARAYVRCHQFTSLRFWSNGIVDYPLTGIVAEFTREYTGNDNAGEAILASTLPKLTKFHLVLNTLWNERSGRV